MDPQQAPSNQTHPDAEKAPEAQNQAASASAPPPVPPATDTPPAAPAPTAGDTPVPVPPAPSAVPPSPSPISGGGLSKGVVLGAIGAVLVLIAGFVAAWFMYLSPAAQSKRLSNSFMHSITTGDVAKATDLSGDSSAKSFLTSASKEVQGTYKLSESKFTNGKGYYLYTLSGANRKYARTIVEVDNGSRVVHSFVFGNTPLALVPATVASTNTGDTSAATPPATTPSNTAGCLASSDFSPFSDLGTAMLYHNPDGTYQDSFQLEFNPDVATYAPGDVPNPAALFADYKKFAAQSGSKQYVVELEASVNSSAPDKPLANARNAKVKSDLVSSGIPASKIVAQPITNDTSGSSSGNSFYRQVQVTLKSASSCATS